MKFGGLPSRIRRRKVMDKGNMKDNGGKILLSDKLPIDPLSVAADGEGNIYVASSAGLLRVWK